MDPKPAPGRVVAIHLCVESHGPMRRVQEVRARRDFGLEGDRHARAGNARQVLLVDAAVLAAERLEPGVIRENLTVEGFPVDGIPPGTLLRVGREVVLRVSRNCEPCGYMDAIRPGLQERLRGRRGTLCTVEGEGVLRVGDPVGPGAP